MTPKIRLTARRSSPSALVAPALVIVSGLAASACGASEDNSTRSTANRERSSAEHESRHWNDEFKSFVPAGACAATTFEVPARKALHELLVGALDESDREAVARTVMCGETPILTALSRMFAGGNVEAERRAARGALIDELGDLFEPRLGIVLRHNARGDRARDFPVTSRASGAQWAFVFWLEENEHGFTERRKLDEFVIRRGRRHPLVAATHVARLPLGAEIHGHATEFAIAGVPGTGALSLCVLGDRFIVSNWGPFIQAIAKARASRAEPSVDHTRFDRVFPWVDRQTMRSARPDLDRIVSRQRLVDGDLRYWIRYALGY